MRDAQSTNLTVKEFAARERVDERTVRRWIQKGAVAVRRTPGGGIRICERRHPEDSEHVTFISLDR